MACVDPKIFQQDKELRLVKYVMERMSENNTVISAENLLEEFYNQTWVDKKKSNYEKQ